MLMLCYTFVEFAIATLTRCATDRVLPWPCGTALGQPLTHTCLCYQTVLLIYLFVISCMKHNETFF